MLRMLPAVSVFAFALAPAAQSSFTHWETPHVHPLEITPDGTRLLAVNTPAARLEVFDLTSGTPVWSGSIPVGLDPVSVRARSDGEAWVVNHVSDSVSVVDLVAGHVIDTLSTEDEPADVVFAGTPARAFVSCSQANSLLVFDPTQRATAPLRVEIRGEDPRALAVSPAGDKVFVAIFESGNRSTVLGGGITIGAGALAFPPNVASDAAGPYGGTNPPPNDGAAFDPPLNPGLPTPIPVSLIVKRTAAGAWLDDNGSDWTALVSGADANLSGRPVGWTLLDHDVAIVDAGSLALTYADGLMNLCMGLAVNPASGDVTVVGTDATNEIRYEPLLKGVFLRVLMGSFDPTAPASPTQVDLNGHLDYQSATLAQGERDKTLSDPRGIAWNATGTKAFVTGLGTNNVIVLDGTGARVGVQPTIEVGEGPTGLVLDEARDRLYVLNKFEGSLSVIDTDTELELTRVPYFDPSPVAIKAGRRHLYDARATSGTGLVSCASCHVDARMDRLAWDLGDPSGSMKAVVGNLGANLAGLNTGFQNWHPMKGPMLTQTMQDIIGKEPHHWRGDRTGIEEFNGAFEGLLGDDEQLTPAEMQQFEDFLATIYYPPNPYREFDNGLPTTLALPGHYTTGRFGAAGQPLPVGNAVDGRNLYLPPNLLDAGALACVTCHTRPTGAGTNHQRQGNQWVPVPDGPDGEKHMALVSVDGTSNVSMKIPQLRNLYERTGFNTTVLESTAGFGYLHDGSVDSIERFVSEPAFLLTSDQDVADLTAFMLAFGGVSEPLGSLSNAQLPRGEAALATHAAVGVQVTFVDGAQPDPAKVLLLDAMLVEARAGAVDVVAHGRQGGVPRGWSFLSGNRFQSDRRDGTLERSELQALASLGNELTFTVVPRGNGRRLGLDRDLDGAYDGDELAFGSDPADPRSRPKAIRAPSRRP